MIKQALVVAGAALLLSACGEPQLEVNVPLAIVNVSPHDGATGIDPQAKPVVCFNRDMDAADATGFLALENEATAEAVGQGVSIGSSPRCLTLEHSGLTTDTGFVIRARQGLPAADGSELAADVVSRFRTAR